MAQCRGNKIKPPTLSILTPCDDRLYERLRFLAKWWRDGLLDNVTSIATPQVILFNHWRPDGLVRKQLTVYGANIAGFRNTWSLGQQDPRGT